MARKRTRNFMKSRIKDYLIIFVISVIISIPLFKQNFNIYLDDGVQHIARLMGTYQTIMEGQFPSVIMSNFCNGFGYSWNIFYSPITAFIPLIFRLFTSSFELMLKMYMVLVTLLSGISMYEFVKKVTKNRYAGLLAAGLYILAPYRLTDMYMRIAIAELTSFIFIPMVFHGLYNILNCDEKSFNRNWPLTIGATGLILSHTVVAMYTAIFSLIYLMINFKKLKDKKIWKTIGVSGLLILLLSSFYLLPLLEHKVATEYEVFQPGRMERTEVMINLKVDATDLLYTPDGELSFEIGLVTLIGLTFTLLVNKRIDKENRTIYYFSLISGFVCIIMSLRFFPFEKMPAMLKMIQFTFRLLEFSAFFLAFVVSMNYSILIKNFRLMDVLVICLIAFLLIVPLIRNLNFEKRIDEKMLWPSVGVNEHTGRVHAGCATFEYLPSKAFYNLDYIKHRENRVYVLKGNATIENERKKGSKLDFNVSNVTEDTLIELPYVYYLGYNVKITDETEKTKSLNTFESENGFVAVRVSELASAHVQVQYTGTILMNISYIVSFLTVIGIVVKVILRKILKNKC